MHGVIAVAQVQRDVLLLLLDVDAGGPAEVDRGRQVQVDAAQAIRGLAEALGLGSGRPSHGVGQVPREQRLWRNKRRIRETREEKLERNESRRPKVK